MNLPNKLTISRILLVPFFMLILVPIPKWMIYSNLLQFMHNELIAINNFITNYGNYIAAGLFIIAASTDGLDGYLARKNNQVTKFGKFWDPLADKLLVTAALIALVERGAISSWSSTIIISREFIITGLRMVAAGEGVVIAAGNWGKIKTTTQMIAIIAALIDNYPFKFLMNFPFDKITMFIAVIITIYSGYDYMIKNKDVLDHTK